MAIPREKPKRSRTKQEAPVVSVPKPKLEVTVKKSFSCALDEVALTALVKLSLPESVRKLPGLSIIFYGGDFCDVSCCIKWESTDATTEELP